MARVNISVPDDLHARAKLAGLSVSHLAQAAIAAELERLAKIAELDSYLAELEVEHGPISDADRADAHAWAEETFGPPECLRTA